MKNVPATNSQNDCLNSRRRMMFKIGRPVAMRDSRGQALVETALTIPLLLLLLIGAAEFGRLAYAAIEVSNAARAGVAYGAQSHITASDSSGMETAATQDGSNITGLTATSSHFCTCSSNGAVLACTTSLNTCVSPDRVIEYVQVNTTATITPMFNYPGISRTFTLTGQAIMRAEQ